jgi:hypothetical protein
MHVIYKKSSSGSYPDLQPDLAARSPRSLEQELSWIPGTRENHPYCRLFWTRRNNQSTASRTPCLYNPHVSTDNGEGNSDTDVPFQCRHAQHLQARNPPLLHFLFLAFVLCVPPPCAVPSMMVPHFVVLSNFGRGHARGRILFVCKEEERDVENSRRSEDGVCCAYRVYKVGCIKMDGTAVPDQRTDSVTMNQLTHQTLPILPQASPCPARRSRTRQHDSPHSTGAILT